MTVHIRDLSVRGPGRLLVDVSDVGLRPGRPVTIVGESGSGKSLLAHAVMGTLPRELVARGAVDIDGVRHDAADTTARRRLWGTHLALLPQEPMLALDPTMRIGAQVAEGAPSFAAARKQAHAAARERLREVGLDPEWHAYPHTLSGGMAQRVAFAAATIGGAPVLIADEPSKGLDEQARDGLAGLLRRHVQAGGVLLTITHDLALARALGGDVLVIREANIVERGPVEDVLTRPRHAYTQCLLAAEPRRWGRTWTRPQDADTADALVTGTDLSKSYGGKQLFAGLDVTIGAGGRLALTGPSGSGKSTLGNVLLRLLRPDSGEVRHASRLAGGRLQKLYQDPALAFPARVRLRTSLGDVLRRHRRDAGRLDELLAALRLPGSLLDRRPGQVSGGELQRIAIIRAMLLEPLLVFADEPTSRLDLVTQQETVGCLMEQVEQQQCALVLVTHDASLAEAVTFDRLSLGNGRRAASLA